MEERPFSPSDAPEPDTLIRLGQIYRPHGVHGELKVAPDTDDPSRFEALDVVYVGPHEGRVTRHRITSVRYQETKRGITVILQLDGITDRGDAEVIAKQHVYVTEDALPPLDEEELFVHDLIGLDVVTEDGDDIGMLSNVLPMPAHDVYVVHRPGRGEQMIPAVEDFIVAIDLEAGRIVVRPIEGLLD
jgi:16S rRNA processing protein RimM